MSGSTISWRWGAARRNKALRFAFEQLAHLIESTGRLTDALELIASQGEHREIADTIHDLRRLVGTGMPLAKAMALHPRTFSSEQLRIIDAGEASGDLPGSLRRIALRLERVDRLRREWLSGLAYPALLVHGVLVILPISTFMGGDTRGYVVRVLVSFALLYLAVGLAVLAFRALDRSRNLAALPVAGRILRSFRAGNACWTLGSLYESGVPLVSAVEAAIPEHERVRTPESKAAWGRLRDGGTLADFTEQSGWFPIETVRVVRIAETAGDLGRALLGEGDRLEDLGTHRLRTALRFTGKAIYIAVVAAVVFAILRFYSGYFAQMPMG